MTIVHVYRSEAQRAVRYRVQLGDRALWIKHQPRSLITTYCCRRKRQARNLIVHVYYDEHRFLCAAGKGCKR